MLPRKVEILSVRATALFLLAKCSIQMGFPYEDYTFKLERQGVSSNATPRQPSHGQ
jgi:hypothetical protein